MKINIKKVLKEIIIFTMMIFIITNVISFLRKPNLQTTSIPEFQAHLITKKPFNLEKYKGEPLLIHFWATWCPTCKLEASNIKKISKTYQVISIAVNSGTDEEIQKFMSKHNLTFTTINDNSGEISQKFKVSVYPTTFIFSPKGELKFAEVGYSSTIGLQLRLWWASLK